MTNKTFIKKYQIEDLSLCDNLIEYHQKNNEYKSLGKLTTGVNKDIKDSIDVLFYNNSNNKFIKNYFVNLTIFLKDYIKTYNLNGSYNTSDRNLIQYYPINGGFKSWHYERDNHYNGEVNISSRAFTYMTYLNDIKDKGETEWYYQKVKIKPKKGLTVIWPTDFTHLHRGIPSPTQEKYIVTGWFVFV